VSSVRRPRKLVPTEPPRFDPTVYFEGLWLFPARLARMANENGLTQEDIARAAGVNQSTVSRWLRYRGLAGIPAQTVMLLENALGLPHGWLTSRPKIQINAGPHGTVDVQWYDMVHQNMTAADRQREIELHIELDRSYGGFGGRLDSSRMDAIGRELLSIFDRAEAAAKARSAQETVKTRAIPRVPPTYFVPPAPDRGATATHIVQVRRRRKQKETG
jgi:transcriptional regulator with XRE-family HTH domain